MSRQLFEDFTMNKKIRLIAATLLVSSIGASANETTPIDGDCNSLHGKMLNGLALNGLTLNGLTLNGPGIVLQGRNFNGIKLNGPGLIVQGRTFNGLRFGQSAINGADQAPTSFRYVDVTVNQKG
jgi:hypothetical protein